jgi:hypothetical protein
LNKRTTEELNQEDIEKGRGSKRIRFADIYDSDEEDKEALMRIKI